MLIKRAPKAFGELLITAVQRRDTLFVLNLIRRDFMWDDYTKKLTDEERAWFFQVVDVEAARVQSLM